MVFASQSNPDLPKADGTGASASLALFLISSFFEMFNPLFSGVGLFFDRFFDISAKPLYFGKTHVQKERLSLRTHDTRDTDLSAWNANV